MWPWCSGSHPHACEIMTFDLWDGMARFTHVTVTWIGFCFVRCRKQWTPRSSQITIIMDFDSYDGMSTDGGLNGWKIFQIIEMFVIDLIDGTHIHVYGPITIRPYCNYYDLLWYAKYFHEHHICCDHALDI